MELPTYTSIWRIEKRLYKLYDFRLPMPVPVGQIAVFAAITVPYVVLLTVFGLPFNHNLFWLYVLPPGLLTWLATRPVLESKRLPELLQSQARYFGEPRTWCRMAPLAEKDSVVIFGRVWRRTRTAGDVVEPATGPQPVTARSVRPATGQVRRPIAPSAAQRAAAAQRTAAERAVAQRGRRPPELQRTRRARATAIPRSPVADAGQPAADPRAWGTAGPVGYPAPDPGPARPVPARGTAPVGYPEVSVGYPEPVREQTPARDAATPWDPGRAGPAEARGTAAPTGYPPATGYPQATGYPPARGAEPAGEARIAREAVPTGYPEPTRDTRAASHDPWPARHDPGSAPQPRPASAADAVTYPGAVRDPESIRQPRPASAAGAAGHSEAAHDPGPAAPREPAVHHEAVLDPRPATHSEAAQEARPGRHAEPVEDERRAGHSEAVREAMPAGQPEAEQEPARRPEDVRDPSASGPRPSAGAAAAPQSGAAAGTDQADHDRASQDAAGQDQAGQDQASQDQVSQDQAGRERAPETVGQDQAPQTASEERAPQTGGEAAGPAAPARPARPSRPVPPVRLVPAQRSVAGPPQARPAPQRQAPGVERVLSGPGEQRGTGWRSHVSVVPGGRSPGRPDHEKEARARAVLPLDGPRLVVVLGCTVGAGQTVTTLVLADLLAGLRGEPVAALDLNPGPASLTELARIPATTVSALLARPPGAHAAYAGPAGQAGHAPSVMHRGGSKGKGRLDVISQDAAADDNADGTAPASLQHSRMLDILASRYQLTLADPGASAVAKVLAAADQLVLVAPASGDAAQAVSMTCEWLSGHGHSALAAHSIAMINGVSRRSVRHAEQAELVLRGRCRAIVRVPWDDHLAEPEAERGIRASLEAPGGPSRLERLHPAVLQAYTALAGVLVSALAADPARRRAAR